MPVLVIVIPDRDVAVCAADLRDCENAVARRVSESVVDRNREAVQIQCEVGRGDRNCDT
jgi:hypothetical protein